MADTENPVSVVAASQEDYLSAFAPLREPLYRNLWAAAVISYTGTWMHNLGTGWLMTSLTTSPMLVGLVQAAISLPVFLVVLPAGALADMVDRRRLLLATQAWMVVMAATLGILTIYGVVTPGILLLLTFLLGLGAVMNDPAWQAIIPEVASHQRLPQAVALNSAGFNIARAVGPAIGGVIIAATSSGVAFLLNAASFFGVILFLHRWKRVHHDIPVPLNSIMDSMKAGFEHLRQSPPVQSVLVRSGLFSVFASGMWAMLPLIARPHGSIGFGFLLGSFGFGALLGAGLLPIFRRMASLNTLVSTATVVFAAVTAALAYLQAFPALCATLLVGGLAWIVILASLNLSAQTMSPRRLRARSLSMYLLVLQGGLAAGSALWGGVAEHSSMMTALLTAATGLMLGLMAVRRHPLRVGAIVSPAA
jgi:MFS family permease